METKLLIMCLLDISFILCASAGKFITTESGINYYVDDVLRNWYDAISVCTRQNMMLVTPDTLSKQADIFNVIKNTSRTYWWTSGQEVKDYTFVWTTNGNTLDYTNWRSGEPSRGNSATQCIAMYMDNTQALWKTYSCANNNFAVICEESPQMLTLKSELESLRNSIENATELAKTSHVNEINSILEENRRLLDEQKKVYDKQLDLVAELKKSLEAQTKLVGSSHESELKHLLEEKNSAMKVLNHECERKIEQMTNNMKSQEIEMLKKIHEMELSYLKEERKLIQ